VNGLQVCNLKPVTGAPPATCVAVGGTCTALSTDDIEARIIERYTVPESPHVQPCRQRCFHGRYFVSASELSTCDTHGAANVAVQGFQLREAAQQGKLGLCVPDLPAQVPVGDNIGQP
jgi:hypothetical protein